MTNYIVSKNYEVLDHTKWNVNRSKEHDLKDNYDQMELLMVDSAKHVIDVNDIIIHRGKTTDIREVFKLHFFEIYELWKTGCNILYVDLDVLFIKHVEFFNKFDKFMMFNYTANKKTTDSHYGITIDHFFNCGVRYYPSTMSRDVWDIGFRMIENWNPNRWNCEQLIYNQMMWSQSHNVKDFLRPELAYQYTDTRHEKDNGINISNAKVIHFHGSRGSKQKLEIMRLYG